MITGKKDLQALSDSERLPRRANDEDVVDSLQLTVPSLHLRLTHNDDNDEDDVDVIVLISSNIYLGSQARGMCSNSQEEL